MHRCAMARPLAPLGAHVPAIVGTGVNQGRLTTRVSRWGGEVIEGREPVRGSLGRGGPVRRGAARRGAARRGGAGLGIGRVGPLRGRRPSRVRTTDKPTTVPENRAAHRYISSTLCRCE